MSNALLLIGERALELRDRLEASGYSTLGWSGAEEPNRYRANW